MQPVLLHHEAPLAAELSAKLPNMMRGTCNYTTRTRCTRYELESRGHGAPEHAVRNATCAVVGSSRLVLASDAGRAIDDADEVIRVNGAPATRRLRAHVGARTTMQVFGVYPTRLVGSRGIRVVLYCSPVWWVGQCWNAIPFDDYERMSVDAWRSVHAEVRPRDRVLNKTRVWRQKRFPSSGSMAVGFALGRCARVHIYGVGPADASCQKYYDSCERHNAYDLKDYHDFAAEWRWYCRLHKEGRAWLAQATFLCGLKL